MPRQSRIDTPGALHHIIGRGRERKKIIRETFAKRHFLSNFCVPDERDLRFASTGLNFNPRNSQCIPVVNPPEADRLPPLKVRDLRLELEQKLAFFKGLLQMVSIGIIF